MKQFKHLLVLGLTLVWLPLAATAQVVTGLPPFGSFSGGPADTVNNANLNVHLEAPVFSRTGRGLSFSYSLGYDSAVWSPASGIWAPAPNWGWTGITQVQTGYISYTATPEGPCSVNGSGPFSWTNYTNFVYHDSFGASHIFGVGLTTWNPAWNCGGGPNTPSGTTNDGSGYTLTASVSGGTVSATLKSRAGVTINAPLNNSGVASGSLTDPNGNVLSVSSSGGTTSFYDTLTSSAVLTLTGSGTSASPYTYAYPNPAGGTSNVVVNFLTYTVKTNFGCSGITEYSSSQPLISSIVYPDGTKYSFTYEPTPSNPSDVTGRIASIALPTGGTISYAYSGGNNGINCEDGTTAIMTRTTPDGTWTYSRNFFSPPSTTHADDVITDPQGNVTLISFQGIYEVQRQTFQGSNTTGTMLSQTDTCYNGTATSWPCATTAVSTPISEVGVRTSLPPTPFQLINQSAVVSFYNSYGLPTETDQYNYGNLTTPARKNLISYASLGSIVNRPSQTQTKDGSNNLGAQMAMGYDGNGNLLSVKTYSSAANFLTLGITYNVNGTMNQVTDPNGAISTYNYGSCNNSFPTSVSMPLSLSTSQTWNCGGAVATSTTDANGKVTTTAYTDPNFWRPTSVTDPTSAVTNVSYFTAPLRSESSLAFNGGSSTSDQRKMADGLGRTKLSQTRQAPGGTTYNIVETDYDSLGRPSRVTVPYSASTDQTNSSAPGTVTTYDALSRPLTVVDGGGGTTTYTYSQNDVLVVVTPAPTGENAKQRQLEYDALGRVTSVCEITSATGSGTCGQNNAKTGFWTKYTYDLNDNLTGVTQNAQPSGSQQTRTYNFDWLSRLTSETNPENGTTAYTYDTDSTCGTSAGDQVKGVDAVGNTTCLTYDVLHRNTAITYPSGVYASATPPKTFVYDAATVNSVAMVNTKGRLAEAYTGPSGSKVTDLGFSYSVRGETTDTYESTPHSGGYYHVAATYWPDGGINTLSSSLTGLPNWTYTPDGEGRVYSVSASSGQNPVTSTAYNVFGATGLVYGSLDSDSFTYDPNTGRETQYAFNVNGSTETGTLTWNANGTLKQLAVVDPFTTGNTATCANVYDDLLRLISNQCGAVWGQTFTYDVFGNIGKSGTTSFQPTYNLSNRFSVLPVGTPTYDNNGNVLTDGFHTYSWDAAGKTTQTDPGASVVSMTYDALGRWVERAAGGGFTEAVYAPDGHELALMSGQTVATAYLKLPAGALVRYESGGLDSYWHPDWLGTPRLYSKPARTIANDVAMGPFGEWYPGQGADTFFTGVAQNVMAVDVKAFPARSYHTTQGRWLSPDPAGLAAVDITNPQSFNRYAYVLGNPLGFTDPTGNDTCEDGTEADACVSGGSQDYVPLDPVSLCPDLGCRGSGGGGTRQQTAQKNCTAAPAGAGRYAAATAQVAAMTASFFSGLGPNNYTFGPDSSISQVMAQSAQFQDVLQQYSTSGTTSNWESFGAPGYAKAGVNPVAQFLGSFQWSLAPSSGGINVTITNVTSFHSLMLDHGPAYERFPMMVPPLGFTPSPMGNIGQTITVKVVCH